MIKGSRKIPVHHLTVRVPWHENKWDGTVCQHPRHNTSCLALRRIAESKDDDLEESRAGRELSILGSDAMPACLRERGSFMAGFPITWIARHPYAAFEAGHRHILETSYRVPSYSSACVPFRWMLKRNAFGDAKAGLTGIGSELKLDLDERREPKLSFESNWVQERTNQLNLLDTFFSAIEEESSLCFFYAKRTPLSESSRRVIVGIGRVRAVGPDVEYKYSTSNPPLRCALWERNITHSVRPGFEDGFLFPYQEILDAARDDESMQLEEYVAFAPDELFEQYSYATELLTHDAAIASLLVCERALRRINDRLPGPWDQQISWIDRELNRLWKARGPFPGLGSALCAFGVELGTLLAYEIAAAQLDSGTVWSESPWDLVDAIMNDPTAIKGVAGRTIGRHARKAWRALEPQRRALLELISRFILTADQAEAIYQPTEREALGLRISDEELLSNPYVIYEMTRGWPNPVSFSVVDRGMFPDDFVRDAFPVPPPSRIEEGVDERRVRAIVIDVLEQAARDGHTLLPRSQVIQLVRDAPLRPRCPLSEDFLAVTEEVFEPLVQRAELFGGRSAFQLERFVSVRAIVERAIGRRLKGLRHSADHDWLATVAAIIDDKLPTDPSELELERSARAEKAAALEELFASRFSVLVGPAGTGKTTLLRALCRLPDVKKGGILLLAPTGKARVRLEVQTGLSGSGKTVAQFLLGLRRYDPLTGRWSFDDTKPRCSDFKTVIVDESSMLTEEQLAALFAGLSGVGRILLVGDPRQLPPIGAGRPFVDIVRSLAPDNIETIFPRRGPGYTELTVTRRQQGQERDDLRLAAWFAGSPVEPAADEIWSELEERASDFIKLVPWSGSDDLLEKLTAELVDALELASDHDEPGFEQSIGGELFEQVNKVYFHLKNMDSAGAASKADDWQILSPVRAALHGVDALNRSIQGRFRNGWRTQAEEPRGVRKVPPPRGTQGIVYGDKVINLMNHRGREVWPAIDGETYLANGDIGIVVGEYKREGFHGLPKKLEVEFASQLGYGYKFGDWEFTEDANAPLELAYALTVHKTQGSEFGTAFVILPNPCWLLSRELIYTALTRHTDRLVVFHQGPLRDFFKYARDDRSDIARRLTNLLHKPNLVTVGEDKRYYEAGLIHRTERGELVRSKSELVIANLLKSRGVPYVYEQKLHLPDGSTWLPDFTIEDSESGMTFFWEHLGLLDNPSYRRRWEKKRARYLTNGIVPWEDGGDPRGTLITTRDEPGGALNAHKIGHLVDEIMQI